MGAQSGWDVRHRAVARTAQRCRRSTVGCIRDRHTGAVAVHQPGRATSPDRPRAIFRRDAALENHHELDLPPGDVLMTSSCLYRTTLGAAHVGPSRELLCDVASESDDLVITSPPFALQRQK